MEADTTLKTAIATIESEAKSLAISNDADYERGGEFVKRCKTVLAQIASIFDPIVQRHNEALKATREQKKAMVDPIERAECAVKKIMIDYRQAQERARQAEEKRLREIARKADEDRRLAAAIEAEQAGNREHADAILAMRPAPPVVVLPKTTPKIAGQSVRKLWKFRIVDANLVPPDYMTPDETKIGQYARMAKETASMSGVEFYSEDTMASTGF